LKVQAWLDGELPDREARRMGELIAHDSEAAALAAELGCVRQAMFRQEAACPLGDSREFYWSKIQRQIQREAGVRPADGLPWYARWRRYMGPLAGARRWPVCCCWPSCEPGLRLLMKSPPPGDGMEAVTFTTSPPK